MPLASDGPLSTLAGFVEIVGKLNVCESAFKRVEERGQEMTEGGKAYLNFLTSGMGDGARNANALYTESKGCFGAG